MFETAISWLIPAFAVVALIAFLDIFAGLQVVAHHSFCDFLMAQMRRAIRLSFRKRL